MNTKRAFIQELEDHVVRFTSSAVGVSKRLPKDEFGRHLSIQISRSALSVALNFAES